MSLTKVFLIYLHQVKPIECGNMNFIKGDILNSKEPNYYVIEYKIK